MNRVLTPLLALALAFAASGGPLVGSARADDEPDGPSPIPFVIAGAGVVAVAIGGVFAAASGGERAVAVDPMTNHADAAMAADAARSFATLANAMFVTSLVLVLFGGGWAAIELSEPSRRSPPATARIGIGVGSLSLSGVF